MMSETEKDEAPRCDGSVFCRIEGHVTRVAMGGGRIRHSHIRLTKAQESAMRAERAASRGASDV